MQTRFSRYLAQPEIVANVSMIAAVWFDQTVTYRLQGAGVLDPVALGGHLRRSFLGAMARGASLQALNNEVCPWDPPCALDIFMREQLRGARGDGLPKPYVLFCDVDGDDLLVSLRVFGLANDWFYLAAEAVLAGMRDILPWQRLFGRGMPPVIDREVVQVSGVTVPDLKAGFALEFITPVDATGKSGVIERSLLSRLLRRVDALARWQGMALDPDYARGVVRKLGQLDYSRSTLASGTYVSPSRQPKTRSHKTRSGTLIAMGDVTSVLEFVAIGARCHIGRAAREGLGRFYIRK